MAFKIDTSQTVTVTQGDSGSFTMTIWTNAQKTIPFDLTGHLVKLRVKTLPAIDLNLNHGISVDPLNGIVIVEFKPQDTNRRPGTYFWDLQIEQQDFVYTVLSGDFEIERGYAQ